MYKIFANNCCAGTGQFCAGSGKVNIGGFCMQPRILVVKRRLPTPRARFLFCFAVAATSVSFSSVSLADDIVARNKAVTREVFSKFKLLPMQSVVIRDYMLSGKSNVIIDHVGTFNGKEVFILRDAKTKDYAGEVNMKVKADGQVEINRLTGGRLNYGGAVKLPIKSSDAAAEEAATALSGSTALKQYEAEKSKPEFAISLPAAIIEGNAEYGGVTQSKAFFNSDGSGYEYGMTSSIASAEAAGKVGLDVTGTPKSNTGFVGAQVKAGAAGPKAGVYLNYFGKPDVDEKGEFSRMVVGGASSLTSTLAEVEAKLGCEEEKGCGTKLSIGALGIGGGFDLKFGTAVKVESYSGGPAETSESITPQEEAEYNKLISTGNVSAMKQYVDKNPTAAVSDELENIIAAKENESISQY